MLALSYSTFFTLAEMTDCARACDAMARPRGNLFKLVRVIPFIILFSFDLMTEIENYLRIS